MRFLKFLRLVLLSYAGSLASLGFEHFLLLSLAPSGIYASVVTLLSPDSSDITFGVSFVRFFFFVHIHYVLVTSLYLLYVHRSMTKHKVTPASIGVKKYPGGASIEVSTTKLFDAELSLFQGSEAVTQAILRLAAMKDVAESLLNMSPAARAKVFGNPAGAYASRSYALCLSLSLALSSYSSTLSSYPRSFKDDLRSAVALYLSTLWSLGISPVSEATLKLELFLLRQIAGFLPVEDMVEISSEDPYKMTLTSFAIKEALLDPETARSSFPASYLELIDDLRTHYPSLAFKEDLPALPHAGSSPDDDTPNPTDESLDS